MNNSTEAPSTNQPGCKLDLSLGQATKTALSAVYFVICILALFGNCAIILIAKTKKRIRKVAFNFFIISMAVADVLDAVIAVPFTVRYFYLGSRWFGGLFGDITCRVTRFLPPLSLAASITTLAAISVDRYLAIINVLREPLSKKKVKVAVFFLWLFSSLTMSVYFIKYKVRKVHGKYTCEARWDENQKIHEKGLQYEIVTKFMIFYVIPLGFMAVLYSSIICVLRRRQAFGENMSQIRIQAQNITVIKMLVTVVLLFAFSWIPAHTLLLMNAFDFERFQCLPYPLILWLVVPSHANGAINPCIYLIFNESYRKGLKQLLVKCRRKPILGVGIKKNKQWPGSSSLERDPSRGGIRGFFRDLSKISRRNSDETTYETRF